MGILLRSAIMLAVAVPAFAATGFRLALWQIVVVAVIGAAAGQLAWKATKARPRGVQLAVTALGVVVAAGGALMVHPWRGPTQEPPNFGLIVVANRDRPSLTLDDVNALTPHVGAIAPVARQNASLLTDDNNWQCAVNGTTPAYFDVRGWRLASGAPFTQVDLDAGAKVIVLGSTTAHQLFSGTDPVGQTIRLQNAPFTIVGVLAPKSAADDDIAIVPLTTFFAKIHGSFGKTFDGVLLISAATPESVRAILRDRHRLAPGDDDDFILRDMR
jgi:hypothetical protein